MLVAGVRRLKARWEVEIAEVAAAKFGLMLVSEMGFSKVVLECDATNFVRSINSRMAGFSPLLLFYEDIARIKGAFDFFNCVHVRRAGNMIAHLVARWNTDDLSQVMYGLTISLKVSQL